MFWVIRCREWYDTGKRLAENNESHLHITPPYWFSSRAKTGQSATSPLIDPRTREHVGQVVVEFLSGPIYESLDHRNTPLRDGDFPILITTSSDADSVVAPGFSALDESARPVSELVLPHDHHCDKRACVKNMEGKACVKNMEGRVTRSMALLSLTTSKRELKSRAKQE